MKQMIAAALLLSASSNAFANEVDDYVACLIGQSAVALQAQEGQKSADAAQDVAYKRCKEPVIPADIEMDGLEDFVNMSVVAIAEGVFGK